MRFSAQARRASKEAVPHGNSFIGGHPVPRKGVQHRAVNPTTGAPTGPIYACCDEADVAEAARWAAAAHVANRSLVVGWQANLLRHLVSEVSGAQDALVEAAADETGIAHSRLSTELQRTQHQLGGFADLVDSGRQLGVIVEVAEEEALPPRPDLRRMLVPIGPVAVFGASNFPLAFGVAGGDTAAALAAGCPVLFKAHPSHPRTSELLAELVIRSVRTSRAHPGTFAMLQGGAETGSALALAPEVKAVAFTGSAQAGRALYSLAAARPSPIPVYAEMGSVNPVFITSAAARQRIREISIAFAESMTLSAGQLCTKPGIVFMAAGREFAHLVAKILDAMDPLVLLNAATRDTLAARIAVSREVPGIEVLTRRSSPTSDGYRVRPVLLMTTLAALRDHPELLEEHFGPVAVVVELDGDEQLMEAARLVPGSLTATVHSEDEDQDHDTALIAELVDTAGRIIYNGYPTGVAVSAAQTHGGPFPASSNSGHTSVGWTSIRRFQRPVTFQAFPARLLPPALNMKLGDETRRGSRGIDRGQIMKSLEKINIQELLAPHPPRTNFNLFWVDGRFTLRVARITGTYPWHKHPEHDEAWYVIEGSVLIRSEAGETLLSAGEAVLIPRDMEHGPVALQELSTVLIVNSRGFRTHYRDIANDAEAGYIELDVDAVAEQARATP